MFTDLEDHPALVSSDPLDEKQLKFVRDNLLEVAPEFVEFVEKFGRVNINNCGFVVYGWIDDLAEFFVETMELEKPDVDAWLFGDNFAGDYAGIDKKTGKVIVVSIENCESYGVGTENFDEFIREYIGCFSR